LLYSLCLELIIVEAVNVTIRRDVSIQQYLRQKRLKVPDDDGGKGGHVERIDYEVKESVIG
jgi:hypothetical protein